LASAGVPYDQWFGGADLLGVMPHMHAIGRQEALTVTRAADGSEECLAEVLDWDFDWQLQYFYEEPVRIGPDDVLTVTCTWDSSAVEANTYPGWGTDNEMCLMAMMLAP
jgi:hypothetical protein